MSSPSEQHAVYMSDQFYYVNQLTTNRFAINLLLTTNVTNMWRDNDELKLENATSEGKRDISKLSSIFTTLFSRQLSALQLVISTRLNFVTVSELIRLGRSVLLPLNILILQCDICQSFIVVWSVKFEIKNETFCFCTSCARRYCLREPEKISLRYFKLNLKSNVVDWQ